VVCAVLRLPAFVVFVTWSLGATFSYDFHFHSPPLPHLSPFPFPIHLTIALCGGVVWCGVVWCGVVCSTVFEQADRRNEVRSLTARPLSPSLRLSALLCSA
jgi:hypothetical protein